MIDINLIPVNKGRRRKAGGLLHAGFVLPREVIIGLVGGFLVLLILGHVGLQILIGLKYTQKHQLETTWKRILPAKKEVDKVMKALQMRQLRYKAIKDIKGPSNISLAAKLNALSDELPSGVWIRDIRLEDFAIVVKGSSVSKHKVEKINVYNYIKSLKQNKNLMDGVLSIGVESVKNRNLNETSIADFIIRMTLEGYGEEEENAS